VKTGDGTVVKNSKKNRSSKKECGSLKQSAFRCLHENIDKNRESILAEFGTLFKGISRGSHSLKNDIAETYYHLIGIWKAITLQLL
jgi:hypothetical protein